MSTQVSNSSGSPNDEIDLGQLFALIKKGFLGIFKIFLRFFVYVRKNGVRLVILAVVGGALGFGLGKISSEKLKTEVIVKPNLESKYYLLDAVEEINGKIKAKDTAFFSSLNIEPELLEKFEISIEALVNKSEKEIEGDLKYLELMQSFSNIPGTSDIIRNILIDQKTTDQRLSFYYKDAEDGPGAAEKLLAYFNNNAYYKELLEIANANAGSRIQQNDSIIGQLDAIIQNYTAQMQQGQKATEGQLVLEEGDQFNIPELFILKNTLIAQTESKRIELQKRQEPLTVVNFGNTQPVKTPLFGESIVLIPSILIGIFILIDIIKYLNRKSKQLLPE